MDNVLKNQSSSPAVSPTVGLEDVVAFIVARHPDLRKWDRDTLIGWLAFHAREGFILPVTREGINIAGLIIVRPVMNPLDGADPYQFDYEGPCLYVGALIADSWEAFRCLAVAVHQRFGVRQSVAWHRRRDHALVACSTLRVARRVLRGF